MGQIDQVTFTVDLAPTTPDDVIKNITQEGVEEILGAHERILYVSIKEVKFYSIEDWDVFVWNDQRGRENIIFISGVKDAGNQNSIHWYQDRRIVATAIKQLNDKRNFIEQCVIWKGITPANLSQ